MRILITGGFGLLAGRLAEFFSANGHEVLLASRLLQEKPSWLQNGRMVQVNWENFPELCALCKDADLVIHAAGVNASDSAKKPADALYFNGVVTTRLVEAAISQSVKRFIYLSTAHVYSDNLAGVISEKACTLNLHPYATSHLAGENSILYAAKQKSIEGIVVRLSNAFGYPVKADANCWMLAVNNLCRQAVEKKKLILNSGGLQHRDFIAIREVCNVISFLSEKEMAFEETQIINIGSGVSQSILSVATLVQQRCAAILGYSPEIEKKNTGITEKNQPISLEMNSLDRMGYHISRDIISEIDEMLVYCSRNFKQ